MLYTIYNALFIVTHRSFVILVSPDCLFALEIKASRQGHHLNTPHIHRHRKTHILKTINLINWIIIAIYCVFALFVFLDRNRAGMDAAGRGMAMGFLLIGLVYLAVLVGLNFINVRWVKILVLLLGGVPLLGFIVRTLSGYQTQNTIARQAKEYANFKDPHLNAMRWAIINSELIELEALLIMDRSQINQVGVTNRETILGIAVQNAFRRETPEADAMVNLVLKYGADPNVSHPSNLAPLAQYGEYLKLPIFQALLKAGADPIAPNEQSIPLVYTIIERGRDNAYDKTKLLLKHGLNSNLPMGSDQPYQLNFTPLISAALHKHWAICDLLIDEGADVNFQPAGPDGRTFWFLLNEKGKEYQESGNVPADYQRLLARDEIANSGKIQ